jgi:hypothetical protein
MHPTGLNILGAWLLLAWSAAMLVGLVVLRRVARHRRGRGLLLGTVAVVVVGLVGQVAHMVEHVVQIGYWSQTPNAPIRMTPWGLGMGRAFGTVDRSRPALGMEVLHLVGNVIFWFGLLGVVLLTRYSSSSRARRTGRIGAWVQGAHCMEHLSLTLSVWFGAKTPVGLSTWFGTLPAGPGLWTLPGVVALLGQRHPHGDLGRCGRAGVAGAAGHGSYLRAVAGGPEGAGPGRSSSCRGLTTALRRGPARSCSGPRC